MNTSHRVNSHHSSESDASVYSSTSQQFNSNNAQFYSSSQESTIVNQFMMNPPNPVLGHQPRPSDQEVMLDEPTRGVYKQPPHSARYPAQGTMGDLTGSAPGAHSLEDDLDDYMAGLQVQTRQDRQEPQGQTEISHPSSSSNPNGSMPSVPSPAYGNQTFDPSAYPGNQPSLSPNQPGAFSSSTTSRMSSTSTSSQDLGAGSQGVGGERRMTEDEVFSSFPGSTSSPHGLSFSKPLEEEKIELANKRERDLQLEEERQKRGSTGSARSEMTAIPVNSTNVPDTPLDDTRINSAASSPPAQTPRLQEVDMVPHPPSMGNRQSSSGLAGLVALGALDDKGREPITFDEGLLRALCDSPVSSVWATERGRDTVLSSPGDTILTDGSCTIR